MKKILKIIGGIFLVIIVLGIIGAAKGSKSGLAGQTSTATTTTTTNSNGGTQNTRPEVKLAKVGDTVTDGDLAFTVNSITTAPTLGGSFDQKTAQGTFYLVAIQIKNNGKETKTINASDFHIQDSQNRKFDYSTDGQTAMEMETGSTSLFLQQVQPSLGVNGKIVFDVPKDATGLKLLAHGDIFSTGVEIDLGK